MAFVLDTNIIVAGLRSPSGASAEILRKVLRNEIRPCVSVPLFLEYESVLLRDSQVKAIGLTSAQIIQFLDTLADKMNPIEIFYLWRPQLRDPADDMVLEVAMNANAKTIVTFNLADFALAPQKFQITLMQPNQFLKELTHGHQ
ncbi:putative toxin-antitoxin system toxin component, PIN family [Methylophilus sp. 5]|uniref:putative toxin-antitoxin system toxin component, PIN family n=1 Tax=Methylophilus sp. 5 TaxID=1112274 RepID=UPI000490E95E|nr:putative toxin-antitoxin system toxin component, PIN family [Methylophilus sp. 5]